MILVLGASGFIGSYMIKKLLDEGEKVLGTYYSNKPTLIHPNLNFIQLDISNEQDYKKLPNNITAVIMFAGRLPANVKFENEPFDDSIDYVKTNVLGTLYALEYCKNNNIKKFLYTSSYSDIVANAKFGKPILDDAPKLINYTGDHSAYIISKLCAIDYLFHYAEEYNMQNIIFRLPPVYGVGPHGTIYVDGKPYKSGIRTFIEKAQKFENIELWGDKNLYRDIIYVKDLVDACYLAIKSDTARGVYNIANGTKLYLEDQIKIIIKIFGDEKKSKIIYRPELKNNSLSYVMDVEKAKRDFGFEPKFKKYEDMMLDYKKELEKGFFESLFKNRIEK